MPANTNDLLPYVSYVLDTALSDQHDKSEIGPGTWLVSYQCGFEPMVVAVVATYTEAIDAQNAEEIAADYLEEIGWFSGGERVDADQVIRVKGGGANA